jgi:hypothetical protein
MELRNRALEILQRNQHRVFALWQVHVEVAPVTQIG